MSEVAKNLLGSGALTVVLVALIQAGLKIYENRTTIRAARQKGMTEGDQAQTERDATWNAAYRSAAEAHIRYDIAMANRVYTLEHMVNDLLEDADKPPHVFPPMPEPPPLFPDVRAAP